MADLSAFRVTGVNNPHAQYSVTHWNAFIDELESLLNGSGLPTAPVNSVLPAITGTFNEGDTLTVSSGTWSGSPSYTYQWRRDGVNIGGATAATHVILSADLGTDIDAVVTATNAGGVVTATATAVYPAVYPVTVIGGVAPVAAYGTCKLVAGYAGSAIRVRRSADNTEQDIGFSGAALDTAAADAFAAGSFLYVTTVYDQSGNGNHAVQATSADQPALDTFLMCGSRVIRFDGGTDSMALPFTVERSALSMLAVASPQRTGTNDAICQLGADQYFYWQEFLRTPGYNGNRRTPSSLTVTAFTASLGAVDIRINDIVSATVGGLTAASEVGGYWGSMPGAGYVSQSTFAGLIFYGRKLTGGELLAGKAALHAAFNVPETTTHTIAVFGDSIAAGTGQNRNRTAIHYASEQMAAGARVYNEAIGGSSLAGQALHYANFTTYESVSGTVVAVQGGTNDIGATVDSAATIYARAEAMWDQARADGAIVIACTILPVSYYDAAQLTRLADLNTLIRAGSAHYDVLNDLAADTGMDDASDTGLYPDGIHPSTAGQQLLTDNWVTAFNAALALL